MKIDDPEIVSLRTKVTAARQEFEMALTLHEVWKPAAYDEHLHKRMGVSYATNAFHVVRVALRREMLLALMRLWDTPRRGGASMDSIANNLRDTRILNALAADRVGGSEAEEQMRLSMRQCVDNAIALIGKYSEGGSHFAVFERLLTLRDKRLAHRDIRATAVVGADVTDEEIESFYQDNSIIVQLLLSFVGAAGYDPKEAEGVYGYYATLFWAAVRSEHDKDHPNYRPRPNSGA
jgi:AbiU2